MKRKDFWAWLAGDGVGRVCRVYSYSSYNQLIVSCDYQQIALGGARALRTHELSRHKKQSRANEAIVKYRRWLKQREAKQ